MTRRRCITEMGMGVDVHGKDATKAAKRAVSDAIRHSSLSFVRLLGKTAHDMLVDVTIGVPNPEGVDTAAVAKELPYGKVTVTAVKGGLEVAGRAGRRFHPDRECGRGCEFGCRRCVGAIHRLVIASEAKQSIPQLAEAWIASSLRSSQ